VQGQTRSGKSTWLYALIVQLVRHPQVTVAGVDPSGITLRPFADTSHARWQASGLADLAALEDVLVALVADMDARLAAMPADRDILPISRAHPLMVTILDEYPALLRALDAADPKLGKRCRALVARLLAESHKVGHRLVIAAQRAEASIVGAAERAQCGGRLSFRVDSADSVKLLHPDADLLAAGHTSAPPGIALCSWPGRPLTRMRGPFLGGYREYAAAVATACLPDSGA
jgi:DNA segregation ATPase FtsK/SpoIIIE-like protein